MKRKLGFAGFAMSALLTTALFQNCAPGVSESSLSQEDGIIVCPEPPPVTPLAISEVHVSIYEANALDGKPLNFIVSLNGTTTQDITVALQSENGTAVAGLNFQAYNDSIKILAGQTSQVVRINSVARPSGSTPNPITMSLKIVSISAGTIQTAVATGTLKSENPALVFQAQEQQIAIGSRHACAIASDKTVKCFGSGANGVLGNGKTDNSPTPVVVPGLTNVRAITAGTEHTCALLGDETVRCWGANSYRQLGANSTVSFSSVPVPVSGLAGVKFLSSSYRSSCAVLADGTARCWGYAVNGQLGNGSGVTPNAPVVVTGLTGATAIAMGGETACAILQDKMVRCWGSNYAGQLGQGIGKPASLTPILVNGTQNTKSIYLGFRHACALNENGTVRCWGANRGESFVGILGANIATGAGTPVLLPSLSGISNISVGLRSACAITATAGLKCWGYTGAGAGVPNLSLTPIDINGASPVSSVGIGAAYTCYFSFSGNARLLKCYGGGQELGLQNVGAAAAVTFTGF